MAEIRAQEARQALVGLLGGIYGLPAEQRGESAALAGLAAQSGMFDSTWYGRRYPDVIKAGLDPAFHYVCKGYSEGRAPAEGWEDLIRLLPVASAKECGGFQRFLELLLAAVISSPLGADASKPLILRQGAYESLYDMPLHVHWSVTNMCNYHCSYCFGQDKLDKSRFTPLHKLMNVVDNLAALNRPAYELTLLGGEPTAHPDFIALLGHLQASLGARMQGITIVTNGSRDSAWLNSMEPLAKETQIILTISIHTDHIDPEHIYRHVRELSPAFKLDLVLMLNPARLKLVEDIYERLCSMRGQRPFDLFLQTVYQKPHFTEPDERYPAGFFEWQNQRQTRFWKTAEASGLRYVRARPQVFHPFWELLQDGQARILPAGDRPTAYQRGLLNFKGMSCVSGASCVRIDPQGILYGAACLHAKTRINMHERQSIEPADFMRLIRCPRSACACNNNDVVMKFREESEAQRFLEHAKAKQRRLMDARRRALEI